MISKKLLVATNNQGKLKEYNVLLAEVPFTLVSLAHEGIDVENAVLKASEYTAMSSLITLADDSGLEVDALGGEPGIMSARYAGEEAAGADLLNYLLTKIKGVPWEKRTARFICVIAIAIPGEDVKLCDGRCDGYITYQAKGINGFGYDPIFYIPELDKTMAELTIKEKNGVSHRAKAAQAARKLLMNFP